MKGRYHFFILLLVACSIPVVSSFAASAVFSEAYLKGTNGRAGGFLGNAVAIQGDTLVVGATGEGSDGAGAVYVFVRIQSGWTQQAYLRASNPDANDAFGSAVAIDGNTLVVGAPQESSSAMGVNGDQTDNMGHYRGAVYVFVRSGTVWTQQAYLKTDKTHQLARLGCSVAVTGNLLVAGAVSESSTRDGGYGDDSVLGAGAAYVFKRTGTAWAQDGYLKGSHTSGNDGFGRSVAFAGARIVVGAAGESSNATAVNGNPDNDNASHSGAAYVFERVSGAWLQKAYLKATNAEAEDQFGWSVAGFNEAIIVGAPSKSVGGSRPGAAYIFELSGNVWSQRAFLTASHQGPGDNFGESVAISEGLAIIGAEDEGSQATGIDGNALDNEAPSSGAAYLFAKQENDWNQIAYLKASNADAQDRFGYAVAIYQNTFVIGAPLESSAATTINGEAANNGLPGAGAAYSFFVPLPKLDMKSMSIGISGLSFEFDSIFDAELELWGKSTLEPGYPWLRVGTGERIEGRRYGITDGHFHFVDRSSRFYRLLLK
jgi:hypothetical protein